MAHRVLVKDVAQVVIGYAPRLGQFGYDSADDAVEGVILMRTGEQAQTVLKRVEVATADLLNHADPAQGCPHRAVLRPQRPHSADHAHGRRQSAARGIVLVVVVLVFFLYDVRSGLIVATTIPLSLLFAFICLDLRHIPANLLSIGAIDFGILVDAAVVMVENIHRQLALRHGTSYLGARRGGRRGGAKWTGRSCTPSP